MKEFYSELGSYTELRKHENKTSALMFLNGEMTSNSSSSESGISARSFDRGGWGFASHPEFSKKSVQMVIQESQRNSKVLGEQMKNPSVLPKVKGATGSIDLSTKKTKFSTSDLVEYCKSVDAFVVKAYPQLSSRVVSIRQEDFIKEGINSEMAHTFFHYVRARLDVRMSLNSDKGPVDIAVTIGEPGEYEDVLPTLEELKPKLAVAYEHLVNKSKGVRAEGGVKEVILNSKLAGILAHEAIGHTTEADLVLGGSVAGEALNTLVAAPMVSLVDFAHTVNGKRAPMPVLFDDEGTLAEDTVIIENGILKGFMNSKETAEHFGVKPTGHARAWGFNDEPLIRMRNTAILPGTEKLEDMIASVDDGYYLIEPGNGQADSTSEFMFAVTLGYEIKKGKLGRAIQDTTISGVAFDMLKTISMLSNELTWVSAGTCGKKQPMTVGMGGPAIKCKIAMGG